MNMSPSGPLANILPQLSDVKVNGSGWMARCPAHEDKNPSLSIRMGDDGRVLLHCFAGCAVESVISRLGLEMKDLFPKDSSCARPDDGVMPHRRHRSHSSVEEAIAAVERSTNSGCVGIWTYHDCNDREVFRIARLAGGDGSKHYRPLWESGSKWVIADPPGPLPLYRLPSVLDAPRVIVCEGEKCVDVLESIGFSATTSAHGAGSARRTDWEALAGRDVVILPDNDPAGRRYGQEVAALLLRLDPPAKVRLCTLPDLPNGGDIADWIAAGGTAEQLEDLLRAAAPWQACQGEDCLPTVVINGRSLRDVTANALDAIRAANDPPRMFVRGGDLTRVQHDEKGTPRIELVGVDELRHRAARCADFIRETENGPVQVPPPVAMIRDILAAEDLLPFPTLAGLVHTPILRPDGTVLDEPGYDQKTQLLYEPAAGFNAPSIPQHPSPSDAHRAADFILSELLTDFPFVDDGRDHGVSASRANLLATLLTPIVRPAIDGPVPLALIDAPQAGTGKTLLATIIGRVATGAEPGLFTAPATEEEWRKQITSSLLSGSPVVLIDNVVRTLDSASLAAAITARVWSARILGVSKNADVPVQAIWLATGNNLRVGGDLPRRCYWVRIDARTAVPWEREGFKHPNLADWIRQERGAILAALLTMARAWWVAGRPSTAPVMGSFEAWSETVGGILAVAGVPGFLENREWMIGRTDDHRLSWEAFLRILRTKFGDRAILMVEVERAAMEDDELRRSLPDALADAAADENKSLARRLGKAFASMEGRRFNSEGLRIERAGKNRNGVVEWRVVCDQ